MATLKKYDISGKEVGEVTVDDQLIQANSNVQMIKDYLIAIRANQRQWSAKTKQRAEVKCSNKKPHAQKGTGKARQGTLAAPQYRGGGIVFGPKPKFNQHIRINKKQRRSAIRHLLSEKISNGNVHVLSLDGMKDPKTKIAVEFLKKVGLENKKVLVIGKAFEPAQKTEQSYMHNESLVKSMRNIPKVGFMPALFVSGYDVINSQEILLIDEATEDFINVMRKAGES